MLLDEIAYHIDTNSASFTLTTTGSTAGNLGKSYMPDTPATYTTIYEYTGEAPQQIFSSSTPAWESPRFQIVCRSSDYQTARNNAETAFKILNGVSNQTIIPVAGASGCNYLRIEPLQSPFSLSVDENNNRLIACNFMAMKELST